MTYTYLDIEQCLKRYPRLARAIQRVGVFSRTETGAAIRDYRDGMQKCRTAQTGLRFHAGMELKEYGGGEAVCAWGGPARLIRDAISHRHFHIR